MNRRIVSVFISLFVSLFFLAGQGFGQGATSRVTGTVVDTTGAVVPDATVKLTNEKRRRAAGRISFRPRNFTRIQVWLDPQATHSSPRTQEEIW